MDSLLVSALVVVGVALLLNLLLTFALVRRVRWLQERTAGLDPTIPQVGTEIRAFEATALDGTVVSETDLAAGSTLVGFFSPTCQNCEQLTEELLDSPFKLPLIAFVDNSVEKESARQLATTLSQVARVALIEGPGAVEGAFRVKAYPALIHVRDGTVAASGHRWGAVATAAAPVEPAERTA